jgi:hypothetical protein
MVAAEMAASSFSAAKFVAPVAARSGSAQPLLLHNRLTQRLGSLFAVSFDILDGR